MNTILKHKIKKEVQNKIIFVKWVIFALLTGVLVGLCSCGFHFVFTIANIIRTQNTWIVYFLPVGGLAIVALYHMLKGENDGGTNLVISAIHSGDHIPLRMAPLIFISTTLTHLFGGSVGREGAALQIGGSIGNTLGDVFKFDKKDTNTMIMCGMSGAFAVLFGTPMAAAIFPMELVSVGIMHYMALVPCVISALTAHGIATYLGVSHSTFILDVVPMFRIGSALQVSVIAILCALVSVLFCYTLHFTEDTLKKRIPNPYIRIFSVGCLLVLMNMFIGPANKVGTSISILEECMIGTVLPYIFLLKIVYTALTLGSGFKGGEIVPSVFVGAAFGNVMAQLLGINPAFGAAIGAIALFCGVTNSPITALLIGFELFGYEAMPFYLITIAFSYVLSGYSGAYRSQKIMYSKYKTDFINKHTT